MTPNEIAVYLQLLLHQVDSIIELGGTELLVESLTRLKERHSFQQGASIITMALGGKYNEALEKSKLSELEAIVNLIQTRVEVRTLTEEDVNTSIRNADLLIELGLGS